MGLALQTSTQANTVIVGLGKTGLSCARFLAARGAHVQVVDSRANPPGAEMLKAEFPDLDIECGAFNVQRLCAASTLVVSPGISLREPAIAAAIAAGVEVIGDIELFARHARAPIVAITGSNGKTTVTSLLGEMAKAANKRVAVGGNIGTPALELLADEVELYVLELSSFQLETTHSLRAQAAVVLNVSQDHLDRYDDMDHYARTKRTIYQGAVHAIINRDDERVAAWAGDCEDSIRFGLNAPTSATDYGLLKLHGESYLVRGQTPLLAEASLKLAGQHNVANALAALALGESVGLPQAAMIEALRNYAGLPHRCQRLGEKDGVHWVNDSKATNVGAAVAAIRGMSGKVVLLAGGEAKGQDFSALAEAMAARGRTAILFGSDAELIARALSASLPVVFVSTLAEAVSVAQQQACPGDTVLLAPACASFDMFKGYEDRGEQFIKAVQEVLA